MNYRTEQENFWAGEFGDDYIDRNNQHALLTSNTALFSKIFSQTHAVSSVIEFGANIGLNLQAIRQLLPNIKLSAVEINSKAVKHLEKIDAINIHNKSIFDYKPENTYDLVLIKGVLIHIKPSELDNAYELLYQASNKYICIAEYYNPSPIEIQYRGHSEKLFKRDFAGEIMDKFPDIKLVDYGFVYHRDNNFPQDDVTWFLFEK